jgi:hypothetical protein
LKSQRVGLKNFESGGWTTPFKLACGIGILPSAMTPNLRSVLISSILVVLPLAAVASNPEPEAKKKPAIVLDMPKLSGVPKDAELVKPTSDMRLPETRVSANVATYEIIKVQHGKSFMRTPKGSAAANGGLQAIALRGTPPTSEKFTTVVRLKSAQRVGGPIELALVDSMGNVAMSANGQITFRGTKGTELDYAVDWEPTPFRRAGEYQMTVRVGAQDLGSFPLTVSEPQK